MKNAIEEDVQVMDIFFDKDGEEWWVMSIYEGVPQIWHEKRGQGLWDSGKGLTKKHENKQ